MVHNVSLYHLYIGARAVVEKEFDEIDQNYISEISSDYSSCFKSYSDRMRSELLGKELIMKALIHGYETDTGDRIRYLNMSNDEANANEERLHLLIDEITNRNSHRMRVGRKISSRIGMKIGYDYGATLPGEPSVNLTKIQGIITAGTMVATMGYQMFTYAAGATSSLFSSKIAAKAPDAILDIAKNITRTVATGAENGTLTPVLNKGLLKGGLEYASKLGSALYNSGAGSKILDIAKDAPSAAVSALKLGGSAIDSTLNLGGDAGMYAMRKSSRAIAMLSKEFASGGANIVTSMLPSWWTVLGALVYPFMITMGGIGASLLVYYAYRKIKGSTEPPASAVPHAALHKLVIDPPEPRKYEPSQTSFEQTVNLRIKMTQTQTQKQSQSLVNNIAFNSNGSQIPNGGTSSTNSQEASKRDDLGREWKWENTRAISDILYGEYMECLTLCPSEDRKYLELFYPLVETYTLIINNEDKRNSIPHESVMSAFRLGKDNPTYRLLLDRLSDYHIYLKHPYSTAPTGTFSEEKEDKNDKLVTIHSSSSNVDDPRSEKIAKKKHDIPSDSALVTEAKKYSLRMIVLMGRDGWIKCLEYIRDRQKVVEGLADKNKTTDQILEEIPDIITSAINLNTTLVTNIPLYSGLNNLDVDTNVMNARISGLMEEMSYSLGVLSDAVRQSLFSSIENIMSSIAVGIAAPFDKFEHGITKYLSMGWIQKEDYQETLEQIVDRSPKISKNNLDLGNMIKGMETQSISTMISICSEYGPHMSALSDITAYLLPVQSLISSITEGEVVSIMHDTNALGPYKAGNHMKHYKTIANMIRDLMKQASDYINKEGETGDGDDRDLDLFRYFSEVNSRLSMFNGSAEIIRQLLQSAKPSIDNAKPIESNASHYIEVILSGIIDQFIQSMSSPITHLTTVETTLQRQNDFDVTDAPETLRKTFNVFKTKTIEKGANVTQLAKDINTIVEDNYADTKDSRNDKNDVYKETISRIRYIMEHHGDLSELGQSISELGQDILSLIRCVQNGRKRYEISSSPFFQSIKQAVTRNQSSIYRKSISDYIDFLEATDAKQSRQNLNSLSVRGDNVNFPMLGMYTAALMSYTDEPDERNVTSLILGMLVPNLKGVRVRVQSRIKRIGDGIGSKNEPLTSAISLVIKKLPAFRSGTRLGAHYSNLFDGIKTVLYKINERSVTGKPTDTLGEESKMLHERFSNMKEAIAAYEVPLKKLQKKDKLEEYDTATENLGVLKMHLELLETTLLSAINSPKQSSVPITKTVSEITDK